MACTYDVIVTRRIPASALKILSQRCKVDLWDSDDVMPREELMKRVRDKHAIYCLLTDRIDKDVLDSAGGHLRAVSTMSVGVDHISLEECKLRGIKLGYTPDILTSATAELTVGLLLATTRRLVEATTAAKNGLWGTWKPMWMCGSTLEGSTVGLFGLGRIGRAVIDRLKPFGVETFLFNTSRRKDQNFQQQVAARWVEFDELLRCSDFLLSCCALTPQTRGVFNSEAFKKMKSTAIFINIARGGVLKQDDLTEALRHHVIRAAGIDVTTPEPLPTSHPLFQLDNCVVTPHIGSATEQTRIAMAELAADNLVSALDDKDMPAPYPL